MQPTALSTRTTVLLNGSLALFKLLSAYALLSIPKMQPRALNPLVIAVLLITACVLTHRRRWQGPLIALIALGYSLTQYLTIGISQTAFLIPFVLQSFALLLNLGTLLHLRQEPGKKG